MRNTIIATAIAALSLSAITLPAAAETTSVAVPYGDLDLTTAAGMATLDGRMRTAVMHICGRPEARSVLRGADRQRCLAQTRASVAIEIARVTGNRAVLALNEEGGVRR